MGPALCEACLHARRPDSRHPGILEGPMSLRAAALLAPLALAAATAPDGARWWSYVEFLASDKLEGRNTGSEGHRKAAGFVAAEFERDGLKPAGVQGYIQPVKFKTLRLDEDKSSLSLVRGGKEQSYPLGEEAIVGSRVDPAPEVEAGLVFVGYGLKVPEIGYDDFAGLDTKGKIAVYVAGSPANLPGALAAHYQSGAQRWKTLKAAGMIGAISIANPQHMDIPWSRQAANRGQASMVLAAPGANATDGEKIAVAWNPAHADDLFAGSGHDFASILYAAGNGLSIPHFALAAALKAKTSVVRSELTSQNIAAIYPGSDPVLKNEYVVMSAHIDHLGAGAPVNGDSIFNGAMDNAAGVATVLDTAAALRASKPSVKRSILFLIVTGEEKGLLGSRYFAENPTVPSDKIVADINTDMFLPLFPLKRVTVYGLDESTLGDDVRAVCAEMGIAPQLDPDPERNSFIRSDQYSFILQGIPALAMKDGYVKGTPEEKTFKTWLNERYHSVSDDLSQPVDKTAAATFDRLAARLLERVANDEARP
ncbi:MAG: M20/M25/M40 family metallo-hydrolase, partial [Acidobacteriota bacterium]|nr:M20/M25/M40 family metallo-hydrolase [Acidobacteriota bacterium]